MPYGCPIHRGGRYVFTASADPFVPYQLTCPVHGEPYPNEEFPERGTLQSAWEDQGWLDTRETLAGQPNPTYGLRYHFNAHYAYWGRWMQLGPLMHQLAIAHLVAEEGDPVKARAAHTAAVLLLRLTAVFPHLNREDFRSAAGVREFPFTVKIMDYVWEPGHTDQYAQSFDYIRDGILSDETLLRLDYGRTGRAWGDDPGHDYDGDGEVTTSDLVAWVEQDLLRAYGDLYMEIPPAYANATIVHQKTLSLLAIVLDEARYYEHARSVLVDHIATNWYTNDGAYFEGSIPGYGQFGLRSLRDSVGRLRRFDPDLLSPRVVKGYLFAPSMVCLGNALPNNDDSGGVQLEKLEGEPGFDPGEYERAYLDYGDPRLLEAVTGRSDIGAATSFKHLADLTARRTEAEARELETGLKSRSVDRQKSSVTRAGYAVLRGGADSSPFDLFVTFDGQAGSHTHCDTFNPILYGFGYSLVPDLGYPPELRGASRYDWIGHPLSHWTVTVDRQPINADFERAQLKLFVDRPGFRVFGGVSPTSYGDRAPCYERTLLLIDKPDGTSIVVDFFRVSGGREHLYSFHGAAPDGAEKVSVSGGSLEEASSCETLQGMWRGEEIAYAWPPEGSPDPCLAYLVDPRHISPSPEADTMRVRFPRGDAEGTLLDMWMPTACGGEFVVAEGRREGVGGKERARLPYLVARNGDIEAEEGTDSLFCAVVEAHQGEALVQAVSFDPGQGALSIRFSDGEEWIVRADSGSASLSVADAGGSVRREVSARNVPAGKVNEVDYDARRVMLDKPLDGTKGEYLIIENDLGRNTFYQVEGEAQGSLTIGDRWTDLCVARGYLTGESDGGRLEYDARYKIQDPIRAQCRGGRFSNASGITSRIVEIDGKWVHLEADEVTCATLLADVDRGDRKVFRVYDFGAGDQVSRIEITDTQEY